MPAKTFYKIGVVGLWHLGSVYAAALAKLGHKIISFDVGKNKVGRLGEALPPAEEPGLAELTEENLAKGRFVFTDKIKDLARCDIIWLAVDMPIDKDGRSNFSVVQKTFKDLIPVFKNGVVVVVSSQVPVGTGKILKKMINSFRPNLKFSYVYQPENMQLGKALESFFKPARVVIGTEDKKAEGIIKNIFSSLAVPVLVMSVASAEMVKHALNSFLATSLSFIYDIADLCENYGADVAQVSQALKSDPRIGKDAYLDASIGFSGGTLGRDLKILLDKAAVKNLKVPVLRAVVVKNQNRWQMVTELLKHEVKDLKKSKVGFLGATYKPGTSTLRHSLSLKVIRALVPEVGSVHVHDPLASKKEVEAAAPCIFNRKVEEMAGGCCTLILLTACPEYQDLSFKKISKVMRPPKFFLDTKNFLWRREDEIKQAGLLYRGIGRG